LDFGLLEKEGRKLGFELVSLLLQEGLDAMEGFEVGQEVGIDIVLEFVRDGHLSLLAKREYEYLELLVVVGEHFQVAEEIGHRACRMVRMLPVPAAATHQRSFLASGVQADVLGRKPFVARA
jgi:hypothetical protein